MWRIVCPPAAGGALGERGWRARPAREVIYDWGGGLIWAALPPRTDAQAVGRCAGTSTPWAAMPP